MRNISMDIANIPKDMQHNVSVNLFNGRNTTLLSTSSVLTWVLNDWNALDKTAHSNDSLPFVLDNNNFAAPFHTSVANVFDAAELVAIRTLTKSKRHLYTATTVGEIEHVDGEYRRTQKLIVGRSLSTEWIYARLERVARAMNEKFWRFHFPAPTKITGRAMYAHTTAAATNTKPPTQELTCRVHESMQFLLYSAEDQGFYDWHMDRGISGTASLRKLSMTVQLTPSNAYDGGLLELRTGRDVQSMPKLPGSTTIFPSYVLHRVTPVQRGEREAIVIWFTDCSGFS